MLDKARTELSAEQIAAVRKRMIEPRMELPDDAGEWDEAWVERVSDPYEEQLERSIIRANGKLNRLNIYLDELYELNGTSVSWNAAIAKMKAIVREG
jgi:hypothetical protein